MMAAESPREPKSQAAKNLPPVPRREASLFSRIKWESMIILTAAPIVGIWGAWHTPLQTYTLLFSIWMYIFSMLGTYSLTISCIKIA